MHPVPIYKVGSPRHLALARDGCMCSRDHVYSGDLGIKLFDEDPNVFDLHRGRKLPTHMVPGVTDASAWDQLSHHLRQAKWRVGSRENYNMWFRTWISFALVNQCSVMPADPRWLTRYFTWMAMKYAPSSVRQAAAAITALHRWNNMQHPLQNVEEIEDLLSAIDKCGITGASRQKLVVDGNFVTRMCEQFLSVYPVFHSNVFNVADRKSQSILRLRQVGMVLLGLELGIRPSSLVALTACCWQQRFDGSVAVQVDLAKNGKNGKLLQVVLHNVPGSFSENYSAIAFCQEYLFPLMAMLQLQQDMQLCTEQQHRTAHCVHCPFLFSSVAKSAMQQRTHVSMRLPAVRSSEVREAVKYWAVRQHRDPKKYSGKSLRRGSTSIAAARRVDKKIRQMHGGWASARMPDLYCEESSSQQLAVGKAIHTEVAKCKRSRSKGRVRFSPFAQ